jgi:endonuclease YncB( thermonuclease family)
MRKSVIAILLIIILAGPAGAWEERSYPAVVTKVIDGDTVWAFVAMGGWKMRLEKIRLSVVDAPEEGEAGYDEATRFLTDLVLHQRVTVILKEDKGKVKCDFYSRVLARIIIHGWDVGELMLDHGLVKRDRKK